MRWEARVRFQGEAAYPEWANKIMVMRRQRARWCAQQGARIMTREYSGTAAVIEEWVTWCREGPVDSVHIVDAWSEKR